MKFLPIVFSSFRRRKTRTVLTMLSIAVAFILFGFLAAIRQALTQGVSVAGNDRLIVRQKVSIIQMLPISYKERIAQIPGVAAVTQVSWFGGIYQDPKNFFAKFPVVPSEYMAMYPEFKLPPKELKAWENTRTGAIAGRTLADKYHWKIGDKIPIQGDIWTKKDGSSTWQFDLVGIYDGTKKATDTNQFLFRYKYFDEARAYGEGQVGWYVVRVTDPKDSTAVAQRIDAEFANSPNETKTESEGAVAQGFANQIGNIGAIVTSILSAVFFTILLVAGNTVTQSVRERVVEIGVLKALGFSNRRVMTLVLAESVGLSVSAGLLGLGVSWAIISQGDPTHGFFPQFYLPINMLLLGAGLSFLLGVATGIFPALRAMRLPVADALRKT